MTIEQEQQKITHCIICGKPLTEDKIRRGKVCCSISCGNKRYFRSLTEEQKAALRKKNSEAVKAAFQRPDVKRRISESSKKSWDKDDGSRRMKTAECLSNNLKALWSNEEFREHKIALISKQSLKYWQNPEYRQRQKEAHKDLWKNKDFVQHHRLQTSIGTQKAYNERHDEIIEKIYQTKKANNSENKSDWELRELHALQTKFSEVKSQYKCDRYPFKCDFYLPLLDLFIECNYFWTHQPKFGAFDETNEAHQKQLEILQERAVTSMHFQNAIDTWTKRDVEKLRTAQKHNLNYKVFYSYKDFYTWFNNVQGDIK